jgi:hypothetical protein
MASGFYFVSVSLDRDDEEDKVVIGFLPVENSLTN